MKFQRGIATLTAIAALVFPMSAAPAAPKESVIKMAGPGTRIHGADISRWQHPGDKAINFLKMHAAGLRFVIIKASDSREESDRLARKYLAMDRKGAQAAGIYTGFYHYAVLPDVTTRTALIKDAQVQAQKALWRLASVGGYNEMDLPYALDIENNCIRYRSNNDCAKRATKQAVTLWSKTFLAALKEKTGRTPIVYSYPAFLERSMARDKELGKYPLWLAQYAIDPAIPTAAPGLKDIGCYVHSWTSASCKSDWVIWQYTSCGIARKYGVPSNRLDLNVFRGTPEEFLALTTGTWIPEEIDLMPINETSTMILETSTASSTDKYVTFSLKVLRPDSSPVVTGDVKFLADTSTAFAFKQTVVRTTSGNWKITLKTEQAGTWSGKLVFTDPSQTHAAVSYPVTFSLTQGSAVTPTPKPEVKPTVKPKPTDGCRYQIKN